MEKNLFSLPNVSSQSTCITELFQPLIQGDVLIERIISHGQVTPAGQWYDQERDEWVAVLQGEARLGFDDGREICLGPGDHALLPKHVKHRVTYTSSPCLWLAVHAPKLTAE